MTAASTSDSVAVMRNGKVVEMGSVGDIFHDPKHPYTRTLLAAIPKLGSSKGRTSLHV